MNKFLEDQAQPFKVGVHCLRSNDRGFYFKGR